MPSTEEMECLRIEVKIAKYGRKSLTRVEENYYSYSPFGNGGGCSSAGGAYAAPVPDPEAYKTAKMIKGVLGDG